MNPLMSLTSPPFDVLNDAERLRLRKRAEVIFIHKEDHLDTSTKQDFFLVVKGIIHQNDGQQFISEFKTGDWFDSAPKHDTQQSHRFQAKDEALLYRLDRQTLETISHHNNALRQELFADFAERLRAEQSRRQVSETQNLMLRKVRESYLREPNFIHSSASILEATQALMQASARHILVRDQKRIGVFSNTNLGDAVIAKVDLTFTPVGEFTNYKLITIHQDEELSEALLLFVNKRIHRLPVVNDDNEIIGILGQADLMSFFSNHSHLIAVEIERSQTIADLFNSADQIGGFIRQQYNTGVKTTVISRMVQTLNAHVFDKLWQLLAPPELRQHSTVIVMGSEGRGEQIMRTDQDNALILADGYNHPKLQTITKQYNQTLADMGYPLCDGGIMMENPQWCQNISDWKTTITQWFREPNLEHAISLSTFLDALSVSGDSTRLDTLNDHLQNTLSSGYPGFINQFARAALQFGDTSSWWQKFLPGNKEHEQLNMKKAGIFPIVHGVRALALEQGIRVSGTHARLNALVEKHIIERQDARDIADALDFMMAQRLKTALEAPSKETRQGVNPKTLSAMERDLLRESLNIVKNFKEQLNQRYQLSHFS